MTTAPAAETVPFGPLRIDVDARVLRPRTWTTEQARWGAELLADAPAGPVLELCSGAGQIGLLTALLTGRRLVCVDADPVACEFARSNATAAGIGAQVEVRTGQVEHAVASGERFPLVLADPPWVRSGETARYPQDPLPAIDGGPDGLVPARRCLAVAARHVHPAGHVILQLGDARQVDALGQAPAAAELRVVRTRLYDGHGALVHLRPADGGS